MNVFAKFRQSIIFLIFSLTISPACFAVEVIRANFEFQGSNHPVDFALFDKIAPDTVLNFTRYIDNGLFDNLLVNRSVPGLVIQAGGYTFDESLNDGSFSFDGNQQFNGGLQLVPEVVTLLNNFKLSNLRGTIAMARIGGQVNSATNQWFINLVDNEFLNDVDGGFTVFGEVLGDGMQSVDLVADIPFYDLSNEINHNSSFVSTPIVDYTISSSIADITKDNLVIIRSFEKLFAITDLVDLGDAVVGVTVQNDIIIKNNNITPLQVGSIDSTSISPPFSILSNPCQNITLQLAEQCVIQVEFTPDSTANAAAQFTVDLPTYGYQFPVTMKTPSPLLVASPSLSEFGVVPVYDPDEGLPEQTLIRILNRGDRPLDISSIIFSSDTPEEFEFTDNCTAFNPTPAGDFCLLVVNFLPADLAEKSASISILSNDPENSAVEILITGGTTTDEDGVDNVVENAVANNGDGNNDNIPDRLQNNVVSFADTNSNYITLVTDEIAQFSEVKHVLLSSLAALPENTTLKNEAFSFTLSGFTAGAVTEFGLILPATSIQKNIYVYGPTADNSVAHWYALENNTFPGASLFGNVNLPGVEGGGIIRNISTIRIVDGGTGDSDLQANGEILFVGGVEIGSLIAEDSGGTVYWLLLLLPLCLVSCRGLYKPV